MTTGAVSIGRKKYAVGLYWENSPSGHIAQAAKEAAKQSAVPIYYYATRSGNEQGRVPQFGLAEQSDGISSGIPSLAGCLSMQQPGSWIGAFKFSEGYAVVIVRDDLIVPDGDMFFVSEGEARDRLLEEIAVGGFQRIYAPESWSISEADTTPISLLMNENASIRLRAVALTPKAKMALAAIAGVLLIVVGVGFYTQAENERHEAEIRQRMAAMEAARRAAQNLIPGMAKPVYPPPNRVWETHPLPTEIVDQCVETMKKVPAALSGWKLTSTRCTESGMSVSWRRVKGISGPPAGSVVPEAGKFASLTVPFEPLSPRGDQNLIDPSELTARYLRQNWGGNLKRAPDDQPPRPPANYRGEWAPPAPPWVKRSFTFRVPVLPWTVPTFLGDLPGVVLKSMTRNGAQGGWTIKGEIYENRR